VLSLKHGRQSQTRGEKTGGRQSGKQKTKREKGQGGGGQFPIFKVRGKKDTVPKGEEKKRKESSIEKIAQGAKQGKKRKKNVTAS